ncbi:uncharacterized protein LOC122477724 [Prionailurus bengalensis]|uniref:uncharacterized protein LOC122477724 n=1 Tax=Prionailurus bengalensis TaxID=37029 RepID=UPI001CA8289C|nr:uncharacterized protein LOC122477724 [Prionailurus bengalensis]
MRAASSGGSAYLTPVLPLGKVQCAQRLAFVTHDTSGPAGPELQHLPLCQGATARSCQPARKIFLRLGNKITALSHFHPESPISLFTSFLPPTRIFGWKTVLPKKACRANANAGFLRECLLPGTENWPRCYFLRGRVNNRQHVQRYHFWSDSDHVAGTSASPREFQNRQPFSERQPLPASGLRLRDKLQVSISPGSKPPRQAALRNQPATAAGPPQLPAASAAGRRGLSWAPGSLSGRPRGPSSAPSSLSGRPRGPSSAPGGLKLSLPQSVLRPRWRRRSGGHRRPPCPFSPLTAHAAALTPQGKHCGEMGPSRK